MGDDTLNTLAVLNRLASDQRTLAERAWRERKLARVAQHACNEGLFSDDSKQTELFK